MPLIFHRYGCIKKPSERYRPNDYSDDAAVGSYHIVIVGIVVTLILTVVACAFAWQWMGHILDSVAWQFW